MNLKLPITQSKNDFVSNRKRKEAVYKLTFDDGLFYIGMTTNFYSRVWHHITLSDAENCKTLSNKQKRMKLAIENNETVKFEIIDTDSSMEREYIKLSIKDDKCLNYKIG